MSKHRVASWLIEYSSVPTKAIKPVASRLGISTNYIGVALFAGELIYKNQDAIVEELDKRGVQFGEFLRERARERYGDDHPTTQYLEANVHAFDEVFEGDDDRAHTFAEFYRQYRDADSEAGDAGTVGLSAAIKGAVTDSGRGPDEDADVVEIPVVEGE